MAKVIVVGAGVSGLLAACFAADRGHEVKVLAYGLGALTVAGGIIDLFGYDEHGSLISDPLKHIETLKKPHPYALLGAERVNEALEAFKALTAEQNYHYLGDGHHNQKVPTAIGSFKPSCLIPPSIDGQIIFERPKILVVGFNLLKDYYPKLIAKNLKHFFGDAKGIDIQEVILDWPTGRAYRDVSALDLARDLETSVGQLNFINQLKGKCGPDTTLIIPPILGERPELAAGIQEHIEQELNTKMVEVSAIPPSVTGLRLDHLLRRACEQRHIEIIDKAQVIGFTGLKADAPKDMPHEYSKVRGICQSLITGGYGREREYSADAFIIATGGVFGSGLVSAMGKMYEPIFDLEIPVPAEQKDWSHQYLFCGKPQPFAAYGVAVNEHLQPIAPLDPQEQVLLHNVQFVGRSLRGYDFCFEKSGNGVAVTTAYQAACELEHILKESAAVIDRAHGAQS